MIANQRLLAWLGAGIVLSGCATQRLNFGQLMVGDSTRLSHEAALLVGPGLLETMDTRFRVIEPLAKPANYARRHFGPFYHGSDFGKIRILVDEQTVNCGTSPCTRATWYFGDYYDSLDIPAQQVARRYYHRFQSGQAMNLAAVVLPGGEPPLQRESPGGGAAMGFTGNTLRAGTFARNLLLGLDRIEYSSRFGGSIRLVFDLADVIPSDSAELTGHPDNFEYELARGSYLFDVGGLEMSIYVHPDTSKFNPTTQYTDGINGVMVEFEPRDVVPYQRSATSAIVSAVPIPLAAAADTLRVALRELATIVQGAQPASQYPGLAAQRFVLSFVHNLFRDELGDGSTADKVTRLGISDDYLDLVARPGIFSFSVAFKIVGLSPSGFGDGAFGDDGFFGLPGTSDENEIHARTRVTHTLRNPNAEVMGDHFDEVYRVREYELGDWEPSPWIAGGKWQLDWGCSGQLVGVHMKVETKEDDPLFDDMPATFTTGFMMDGYLDDEGGDVCSVLEDAVATDRWGTIAERQWDYGPPWEPGSPYWWARFQYRLVLSVS